jgi:hypothetical protein
MKEVARQQGGDMVPLNDGVVDFDLDSVQVEELERRFEMALALPAVPDTICRCPQLQTCGTYCSTVPPT